MYHEVTIYNAHKDSLQMDIIFASFAIGYIQYFSSDHASSRLL